MFHLLPAKEKVISFFLVCTAIITIALVIFKPEVIFIDVTGSTSKTLFIKSFSQRDKGFHLIKHHEDGSIPLVKQVVAIKGDLVVINHTGIMINGEQLPNSQPLKKHLDKAKIIASTDCVVIYNNHTNSYDSRYFGCIDPKRIITALTPLL